jgi:hypothetical protein
VSRRKKGARDTRKASPPNRATGEECQRGSSVGLGQVGSASSLTERFGQALLLVALAVGLVVGSLAYQRDIDTAVRLAPPYIVSPQLKDTIGRAAQELSTSTPVAFVSGKQDMGWTCGLWQRELYPRPVFCVPTFEAWWPREFESLRKEQKVRHIIADGAPPAGITLVHSRTLGNGVSLAELLR